MPIKLKIFEPSLQNIKDLINPTLEQRVMSVLPQTILAEAGHEPARLDWFLDNLFKNWAKSSPNINPTWIWVIEVIENIMAELFHRNWLKCAPAK
ncbi:hypothetical protein HAX54_006830, partial [Datura stramonium]|nr:hypothetical protein [Datura stramonium]